MSKSKNEKTDRRGLGWLAAGMLFFLLSSSAWALDLDQSIAAKDFDSTQLAMTLGHGQSINAHTSQDTAKTVRVALVRHKHHG